MPYTRQRHYEIGVYRKCRLEDYPRVSQNKKISQIELENIVGNLMIAQYHEDRLRSMLGDRIVSGVGSATNNSNSVTNGTKLCSN